MALETANFTSKSSQLRLVRQPGFAAYNALGKQQGWLQKSIVYEFVEIGTGYGRLTLKKGQDELQDGPLNDETGEPTYQDAIAWIRQQPGYNAVGAVGGFVEEGREPGRVPDATDVLDDITEAGVSLDPDKLREILTEEQATWQREQVITLAKRTLGRVEKQIDAQDAGAPQNAGNAAPKTRAKAAAKS